MPDAPLLLCYDGSENAKHAIRRAPELLRPAPALVLSVWQDVKALPPLAWSGAGALPGLDDLYMAARDATSRLAEEGAGIAREAGLDAEPIVAEAPGPVWDAIMAAAEDRDAATIVMGSRGLSSVKQIVLGSVSSGVLQRTRRPTLVVPHGAA